MLWFNEEKGYGLIATEDEEQIHVDGSAFAAGAPPVGRCSGLPVSFELREDGDERRADQVVLVDEIAPRRARMRRSGG